MYIILVSLKLNVNIIKIALSIIVKILLTADFQLCTPKPIIPSKNTTIAI